MQEPSTSDNLKDIPLEIERLRKEQLNLHKYQEEYKQKVGLSGHTRSSLPFHPKALETELRDVEQYYSNLQRNYTELLTKERFLQYMLQEPPLEITDTSTMEKKERILKNEALQYISEVDQLAQQIKMLTESIETTRSNSLKMAEDVSDVLEQISLIEDDIAQINAVLATQSKLTVEEAKATLKKQTDEITQLNKTINEKEDAVADYQWHVEDLEEEVNQLKVKAERLQAEADEAVHINENRDKQVEIEYEHYIKYTDMCNHMFGVERIDFESSTSIHVVFAKPRNAVLHIELDIVTNRIENASLTGTVVPIQDLIKMAKRTTANDGIRMIILETLARLKKKN